MFGSLGISVLLSMWIAEQLDPNHKANKEGEKARKTLMARLGVTPLPSPQPPHQSPAFPRRHQDTLHQRASAAPFRLTAALTRAARSAPTWKPISTRT